MKNFILVSFLASIFLNTTAQVVEDSISMGPNYTNDVYYSLNDGTVKEVGGANWTVAFYNSAMSAAIMINEARGVALWNASENTADFASITDTTGLSTWTQLHDEDSTWDAYSAFEDDALGGNANYGWGEYNFTTHLISASRVFVLKTIDERFFKVMVVQKETGTFTYRYASLDNSFDTTMLIYPADMLDRNYAYLNMDNHTLLDIEPNNNNWDIVFNKYSTDLGFAFYPVTGVQLNVGVQVAKILGEEVSSASYLGETFLPNKNIIGYDWKYLIGNMPPYYLVDSLTYFIKTNNDDIYKLYFTAFEGGSTGKVKFNKEFITNITSIVDLNEVNIASIYPNPCRTKANVLIQADKNTKVSVEIYSVLGNLQYQNKLDLNAGLNDLSLDLTNYENGLYLVQIIEGNTRKTEKLIVNH
ncbi:MAG: T9SS type A sorting domain-containing protein [Chitinophagales bacterium]|nr:T9SS type A sorting domain-containing protein [Chitinophagales bacterium]